MQPLKEKQLNKNKKLLLLQYTQKFYCINIITRKLTYTTACFDCFKDAQAYFDATIR